SLSISEGRSRLTLRRIGQGAGHILVPDRPDDAAEFIRNGDRGLVVTAPLADTHRPLMQARERLPARRSTVSRHQDGARAMRQETPKADIALRTDRPEPPPLPTGMLAGRQAEPARKLTRAAKRVDVADGAHSRRRRQETNAGNGAQARDD